MATEKVIIYKGIPYFSDVNVPTRVSQLANDAGYVTTDEKVKQTPNTTSLDSHPILFSASDSSGEVVGGTYKNPDFYYNPNLNRMIFKNGGGIEVRYGAASVSVLSQYMQLSDLTDAHSIMNITTEDIELDDVTYQGTTYNNTWDGTHHSLKSSINSLVSKTGDTISGDYVNTADFSESGVYGKRVTTYGPWGIDVEEYVGTSLWSRLSLRDSDILLTKTWDGTHDSLKSSISSLNSALSDYVKIKSILVNKANLTRGMSLASYVQPDTGYKFCCWLMHGASNGWVTSMPIYISAPGGTAGYPFWHPNLTIGGSVNFCYLEIKNV